jgi:hypothetical protein
MIQDMQHMAVFESYQKEIYDTLAEYRARASGVTDKLQLIQLYIDQNEAVNEVLRKQHRAFRWMRGEKVESEHHLVYAQIDGRGGVEVL